MAAGIPDLVLTTGAENLDQIVVLQTRGRISPLFIRTVVFPITNFGYTFRFSAGTFAVNTWATAFGFNIVGGGGSSVEANVQIPVLRAGTLSSLRVRTISGVVSAAPAPFAVRINGVGVGGGFSCAIPVGGSNASNLVNTAPVLPGDLLSIRLGGSGAVLPSPTYVTLELLP